MQETEGRFLGRPNASWTDVTHSGPALMGDSRLSFFYSGNNIFDFFFCVAATQRGPWPPHS